MRLVNLVVIASLAPAVLCAAHGAAPAGESSPSTIDSGARRLVLAQSETHINQIDHKAPRHGPPPEGALLGAQAGKGGSGAAAAPAARTITCNATNAASPDCYAATQQARPLAK
jgi:hypothetical protein